MESKPPPRPLLFIKPTCVHLFENLYVDEDTQTVSQRCRFCDEVQRVTIESIKEINAKLTGQPLELEKEPPKPKPKRPKKTPRPKWREIDLD